MTSFRRQSYHNPVCRDTKFMMLPPIARLPAATCRDFTGSLRIIADRSSLLITPVPRKVISDKEPTLTFPLPLREDPSVG
jgi:hypothetical protein